MAKIVVLDAFCWIKNTEIDFSRAFAPKPTGLAYTVTPLPWPPWWAGGLTAPVPKKITPASAQGRIRKVWLGGEWAEVERR